MDLSEVRTTIRLGCYDEALAMLLSIDPPPKRDAVYLNLLGVTYEGQRNWKVARRCYGKAIGADRRYAPAQQNMRRWYELFTFGRSAEHRALGDERSALAAVNGR